MKASNFEYYMALIYHKFLVLLSLKIISLYSTRFDGLVKLIGISMHEKWNREMNTM